MKRNVHLLFVLLLALGLLLSACGGTDNGSVAVDEPAIEEPTAAPAVEEPAAAPTEEPAAAEPVVEPAVEPAMPEFSLDASFGFLSSMVAYNTIGLEDTNLALAEDPMPFLLDVREVAEAETSGHIEGAVLVPLRELGRNLDKLPSFDTPIIAYCGSGWRATIAMTALEALGWTDVKVLKGGSFTGWVEAGYPAVEGAPPAAELLNAAAPDPAAVAEIDAMLSSLPEGWGVVTAENLNTELIENPDLILLDVRTAAEVEENGYIDAAIPPVNLPIESIVAMQAQWPADKDAPIVIYCGSGHRSTIGMAILRTYGYTNVRSLKAGYAGWAGAGYAIVPGTKPIATAEVSPLDAPFTAMLDSMVGYNIIGLEDANAALIEDKAPFLLDVREVAEAETNGHIEGAVLIPIRELGQNLDKLPSFDTPIIAYCGSGWRATIAMTALEALGWTDVTVLKDGSFGGWVAAGYPVAEGAPPEAAILNAAEPDAALVAEMDAMFSSIPEGFGGVAVDAVNTELIENDNLILIDVRRADEIAANGVIDAPNLVTIPLETFVANKALWPAKDAAIVVYCGSGHRSTIAATILWAYGFDNVRSMKGGFGEWKNAGYPIVGGTNSAAADLDAAFNTFLAGMQGYNTIGIEDLNLLLIEDSPPFLLDVREPAELEEKGWIEGAVNIPLRQLADNLAYLPGFDTTIVSYCGSGWRCTIALTALEALGWENVLGLKDGSFGGWAAAGYPVATGEIPELVALNAATPDPALVAAMQTMLQNVPDGYGVITADDLFLAQTENPDLILIDVRRTEELAANGVIEHNPEGWIHIPLEEFVKMQDQWPADLDAPIVVYCGSGHRSTIAMSILWSYGYSDVHSLKGGFAGWVEAAFPVAEFATP